MSDFIDLSSLRSLGKSPAIEPGQAGRSIGVGRAESAEQAGGPSFGEALESALKDVDGKLQSADATAAAYLSGEGGDIHNVLLEVQRADVSFKTMLQVRNKVLDAYREVMRMSV